MLADSQSKEQKRNKWTEKKRKTKRAANHVLDELPLRDTSAVARGGVMETVNVHVRFVSMCHCLSPGRSWNF